MKKVIEEAYETYYQRLFTLAFRITGDQAKAEDVLQDAFYNALQFKDSYQGKSTIYTWLYAIVLNAARGNIRKEEKLPVDRYAEEHHMSTESVYEYIHSYGELPDEHTVVEQVRETCLQMFLNCLPPQYRIPYTLRIILQCSVQESAEILELPENTIKTRVRRAKELLKEHFHGRCSLLQKDGLCNCRTFATHVKHENKLKSMLEASLIKRKEAESRKIFDNALTEILDIAELYQTEFTPIPFSKLRERVMLLYNKGTNPLLS